MQPQRRRSRHAHAQALRTCATTCEPRGTHCTPLRVRLYSAALELYRRRRGVAANSSRFIVSHQEAHQRRLPQHSRCKHARGRHRERAAVSNRGGARCSEHQCICQCLLALQRKRHLNQYAICVRQPGAGAQRQLRDACDGVSRLQMGQVCTGRACAAQMSATPGATCGAMAASAAPHSSAGAASESARTKVRALSAHSTASRTPCAADSDVAASSRCRSTMISARRSACAAKRMGSSGGEHCPAHETCAQGGAPASSS